MVRINYYGLGLGSVFGVRVFVMKDKDSVRVGVMVKI